MHLGSTVRAKKQRAALAAYSSRYSTVQYGTERKLGSIKGIQPGHPIRFCAPGQEGGQQLSLQPGRTQ